MTDKVQRTLEGMVKEFEAIESLDLLEPQELVKVKEKRRYFETRVSNRKKAVEDYLSYIQYETDLLGLITQRRRKMRNFQRKTVIDSTIKYRVNTLYILATEKFPQEMRIWTAHLKFCKTAEISRQIVSDVITRMLQTHPNKPECWHVAADWQKNQYNNVEKARELLLDGLKVNENNELLYADLFKLELEVAQDIEIKEEHDADPQEIPQKFNRAVVAYKYTLRKIKNAEFFIKLLNIAKDAPNTEKLQARILTDLVQLFKEEHVVWDMLAHRELEGLLPQPFNFFQLDMEIDEATSPKSTKMRIANCNKVYQKAVQIVNTPEMWTCYIQCLLNINLSQTLPKYKKKILKSALLEGHNAKKLTEQIYLQWLKMFNSESDDAIVQSKIIELLKWATEALPDSATLWNERLKYLLSIDHAEAVEVFEKGKKILGSKSLPLWKTNLLFIKSQDPEKLEEFYMTTLKADPVIANVMKPNYIEWLAVSKGIEAAREAYKKLVNNLPFCLELHETVIKMELAQPKINVKRVREVYEKAILQFGEQNVALWLKYINFEITRGDSKNICLVREKAGKMLDSALKDVFDAHYNKLRTTKPSTFESVFKW